MAISAAYVARETTINLRRNIAMTIAAVLTVAVSLSLVGSALLMRQGVNKASIQWRGGVELSVFLRPDVSDGQRDAIQRELSAMPEVKRFTYVDKKAALAEYRRIFANNPDIQDVVTENDLPPSFRIVPAKAELIDTIGQRLQTRPGVTDVVFARDAINKILTTTRRRQVAYLGVALVLLVGAVLLIVNAIQLAVLSRRREIEVMKLVGATNWFIRLPFMMEGTVQGLLGGLIASMLVFIFRSQIVDVISDPTLTQSLRSIGASSSEALGTAAFLMLLGAVIGASGSAAAVRRHLHV